MISVKRYAWLFPAIALFVTLACKKKKYGDDSPSAVPSLTTTPVFNVTINSAISGGNITSDGKDAIIASGVCYSSTVQVPTIAQDTTKGTVASGNFYATMHDLQPNLTYYVRAYAINSVGIGYGNVVSFNSAIVTNAAPEVRNITILGTQRVASIIRVRFTNFDAENDLMIHPLFQWYAADDTTTAGTPIAGATDSLFTIKPEQQGKFLKVVLRARALSGTVTGVPTSSKWVGPVEQPETVTFNYNGQSVTYGVVTSPKTGRKFLDRNLGAPNVATAYDDWQNMGDLFQWGRRADGHQLIIRRAPNMANVGVNDTTSILSSVDNPGHSLFIITTGVPANWRRPGNPDLWQVSGGVNNVCPAGWHIPSREEWAAEQVGRLEDAYTQLKITAAGIRNFTNGRVAGVGRTGNYWSSSATEDSLMISYSLYVQETTISAVVWENLPASGCSVRCVKD